MKCTRNKCAQQRKSWWAYLYVKITLKVKEKNRKEMINNEIKSEYVNVAGINGLTKMTLDEAINIAEESGEDVVIVNKSTEIPVVKIIEYSKYLYDKKKKDKENKKKSRLSAQDTKEIRISESIEEHDIIVKAKNIDRIIANGDKVKLSIRYKGRLIRQIQDGPDKLRYLASKVKVKFKIDKEPLIEGNTVTMIISPCR